MKTTLRAILCLLLIAGFYLTALLVVLSFLALGAVMIASETALAKASFLTLVAAWGVLVSLHRISKAQRRLESGTPLSPGAAPELWAIVTELAGAARTRGPSEILLIPGVNAAVSEDARLLGLLPGTRRLYIGVPLLQSLDVAQLRSVIAHELGHYAGGHTRLGAVAYRGREVVSRASAELTGFAGWVLRGYARLYLLVSAASSRRQELEADAVSVRVAGREVATTTLHELEVVNAAWEFYFAAYVADAWEAGLAPTSQDMLSGFPELLAARAQELDRLRLLDPPSDQSRWDSHPSTAVRIAAMNRIGSPDVPRDTREAHVLVPGLPALVVTLTEMTVDAADRERLPWAELTPRARAARAQHTADVVFRATARVAGVERGSLADLLALTEAGRLGEVVHDLGLEPSTAADPDDASPATDVWVAVLRCALVECGAARWQHRWDDGPGLLGTDGEPLDLQPLARLGSGPASGASELRTRLTELGVDLDAVGASGEADARGARIVAGVANVRLGEDQYDVLLLSYGVVLVPCYKQYENGTGRLRALASSGTPAEIAARHWYVPFEDVATSRLVKRFPTSVTFTLHDGTELALRARMDSQELASGSLVALQEAASHFAARPVPA